MVSASRAKIEGKDESAEPDSQESRQKLAGRTIVAGDRLQDNLLKSVSGRFCHADVTLLENASSKSGLGSCWNRVLSKRGLPFEVENEKVNENNLVLTNLVARAAAESDLAKDISRQEQHLSPLCN